MGGRTIGGSSSNFVTIEILPRATNDILSEFRFYEQQAPGLGRYFRESIFADVESLRATAGVHSRVFGFHRSISKKFPVAIYYQLFADVIRIHAILDCRRNPKWIRRNLGDRLKPTNSLP